MEIMDYILLAMMTFIAYMVKGMTGFGNTVIMAPMYAQIVSPKIITPIDLVFSLPTNTALYIKNRQHVKVKKVASIIVLMLIGSIPGALILKYVEVELLKVLLGILIVGISLDLYHHKYMRHNKLKPNKGLKIFFSLLAGLTVGMFGISLPIAVYLNRASKSPDEFKGGLSLVFLADNVIRTTLYIVLGLFTADILRLAFMLLPVVFIGMAVGMWLSSRIAAIWIDKMIILMLLILGMKLILFWI